MKAIKYCGRKYQTTHYNKIKRNDTINDREKKISGLVKSTSSKKSIFNSVNKKSRNSFNENS
jgi:hypothetical protein